MEIERMTHCDIGNIPNNWDLDNFENTEEIADGIEAVRDDHSGERVIDDGVYMVKLHWNENIEDVQVSLFTYNGGFKPGE